MYYGVKKLVFFKDFKCSVYVIDVFKCFVYYKILIDVIYSCNVMYICNVLFYLQK